MSIRGLKKMAILLMVWVAMESCRLRADQTIMGNLTVTGSNVYIGTQTGTTNPGWGTIYTDGTNSTVEFEGTRSGNTWAWLQNNGTVLQMTLDNTNTVTLYNSGGTAEITLNPTGTSNFNGSVTIGGTDNEMPNQTLVNGNSVLTESLGDSRYILPDSSSLAVGHESSASGDYAVALGSYTASSGDYSFTAGAYTTASARLSTAIGGGTASGQYALAIMSFSNASNLFSTALGGYATASGQAATAIGTMTTASGQDSLAMGTSSTADGYRSTAIGYSNTASGPGSTAIGYTTTASGTISTASGYASTASGNYSTASGYSTTAQALNSFVIGAYNVGGGSATTWVATDPLFEVGNGIPAYFNDWATPTPSDALVVYKNGNTAIQGQLVTGGVITAPTFVTTTQNGDIPMYTGY